MKHVLLSRKCFCILTLILGLLNNARAQVPAQITTHIFFDISQGGTPLGRIVIGLFGDVVPKTAKNFEVLATSGVNGRSYAGSAFHRVIKGFMIQGGDIMRGDGTGSVSIYGGKFEDENFLMRHSVPGLLSMANSGPDSNGSQFFITVAATPHLDGKHVVFGQVLQGLEVVYKIADTDADESTNRPYVPVVISNCGRMPPGGIQGGGGAHHYAQNREPIPQLAPEQRERSEPREPDNSFGSLF